MSVRLKAVYRDGAFVPISNGEKLNVPENAEVEITVHDPYVLPPTATSDEEREQRSIRPVPATLKDALDALEKDSLLMRALGKTRSEAFLLAKSREVEFFAGHDKEFEVAYHRARF